MRFPRTASLLRYGRDGLCRATLRFRRQDREDLDYAGDRHSPGHRQNHSQDGRRKFQTHSGARVDRGTAVSEHAGAARRRELPDACPQPDMAEAADRCGCGGGSYDAAGQ